MKKISLFDTTEMESDDRGVSPVIGVILMVAITVILAAVIASFVLGFGSSASTNATAGVDVDNSSGTPTVTIISIGENTAEVQCVDSSGTSQTVGDSVGESADCDPGENVVAVGDGNTNDATIRTNI